MIRQKIYKYYPLFIPLVLWSILVLITQSQSYKENPSLMSMAVTIDFLFLVPFLYFLSIRRKEITNFTVFTVFVVGIVLASWSIPGENQFYLENFKFYVLPFIELGVLSFIVYKTVKTIQAFKASKTTDDFYSTLLMTTKSVFPKKISSVVATEIAMVYYGFILWKKRDLKDNEFTYHKKNALVSIIGGLTLVILGETIGLHAWLVKWNAVLGWVITLLSAYTAIQFFALAKSIVHRPILVDTKNRILHLKYGFFVDCKINLKEINSVEIYTSDLPEDKSIKVFSPLGSLGEHNLVLHFKKELKLSGFYGLKKKATSLAIYIDEKERFVEMLERNMLVGS